jgi:hypothetical protein
MKATSSSKRASHINPVELGSLVLTFLCLAATGYGIWQAMQPAAVAAIVAPVAVVVAPPLAPLNLNTTHSRQGQVVEVHPGDAGRANPFLAP